MGKKMSRQAKNMFGKKTGMKHIKTLILWFVFGYYYHFGYYFFYLYFLNMLQFMEKEKQIFRYKNS